jgi:hypothetical protein
MMAIQLDIMETIKPFGKTVNLNKILTFKNRWVEIFTLYLY